jgi:hypothetical protein
MAIRGYRNGASQSRVNEMIYVRGESMADVTKNGELFLMCYGIVGDKNVDGPMQVFGSRSFNTEKGAVKAAIKWINS